jgi:catalase-peroxidase
LSLDNFYHLINIYNLLKKEQIMQNKNECQVTKKMFEYTTVSGTTIDKWFPNMLNLKLLSQNRGSIIPNSKKEYKEEFEKLNLNELKEDLIKLMKTSQDWWPADFGHYGPLFIRMTWHSAGTYRITDGKGGGNTGNQRFAPINSWPDNANLDKAKRLLWPIKKRYGDKISWADLFILAGNTALESMGFKTLGFAGGRKDIWEPEEDIYWGPEQKWMADERRTEDKKIENPLAAVQMGLIYVNPEGPDGTPDALAAANDIRISFQRMGMNDEETVALIAGGHTFGKCHGAASPDKYIGKSPEAAPIEEQGIGWKNSYKTGKGADTITSGLEGAWTPTPVKWDNSFFETLFKYDWNLEKSPAGAWQWVPSDPDSSTLVPDAHQKDIYHKPIMLTTDLALRMDPEYRVISQKFLENPKKFQEAFAKAWFKLLHRDLGGKHRYLGDDFSNDDFIWQDPVPEIDYEVADENDIEELKSKITKSGLNISELVYTAWSAASTFRISDYRGGVNGARIALSPQKEWEANMPQNLKKVLTVLTTIKDNFDSSDNDKKISLSDLIIIGGIAAIEEASKKAGYDIKIPFKPGRNDTTQDMTDVNSFDYLKPVADGFRNYENESCDIPAEMLLIDKAQLLTLSVPEMTVLIGGMRALGATYNFQKTGVLTKNPGRLTNDFFVNLLDMDISWKPTDDKKRYFNGYNNKGELTWKASRVDLIFGSNSQLRAQAEFYAQDDNKERFVHDFIKSWTKVMNLDICA